MELQWPLVVFTTFICLSAGTFGFISVASMKKEYARIQLPGLITAFAALVVFAAIAAPVLFLAI